MEDQFTSYLGSFRGCEDFRDRTLSYQNILIEQHGIKLLPLIQKELIGVDFFHVNQTPYDKRIILLVYLIGKLRGESLLESSIINELTKRITKKVEEYIMAMRIINKTVLDGIVCIEISSGETMPFSRPLIFSGSEIQKYYSSKLHVNDLLILLPKKQNE